MKKFILSLCTLMSISLNAQEGSQPLHISNVTIIPGGCGNPSTVTLTAQVANRHLMGYIRISWKTLSKRHERQLLLM